MTWAEEVEAARLDVWAELTEEEREFLADLPVQAMSGDGSAYGDPAWGRFFGAAIGPNAGQDWEIHIYRGAFEDMPDPENRNRQLRDVIRHEYHHGLGEWHAGGQITPMPDAYARWLQLDEQVTFKEDDGLRITLPEIFP